MWPAGLAYLKSAAILSIINYSLKDIPILDGSAESNPKLPHTLSKYQFAIILKIKVAINNNIQNFVSLRPWIKYSGCPLNMLPSNRLRTRTCNVRKMSRMYNTVGAPGELYPLASIVKRQLIYYLYMSKLIYPTCKTPWWSLLLSDEMRGR